jgi:UDP-glucose 4-epimerase
VTTSDDFVLTTVERQACAPIGPETVLEIPDIFAPPEVLFDKIDVVINFAGIVAGRDAKLLDEVNAKGPPRLAELAKRCGVRHFVQLSSLHVYGSATQISRATPVSPVTPYGWSKLHADTALLGLQGLAFAVSLLRLPMLYGGGTGENLRKLATLMTRAGVFPTQKSPAPRSVLHVDNLAVVLQTLARNDTRGVCFAADADHLTIELLAEAIGEATGRGPRLVRLPDAAFLPLRIALRSLYNKLYESNFVLHSDCVVPDEPLPVLLRDGLLDMLSNMRIEK